MTLKLYYDLLSQPSRTLFIFMKVCNISFESIPIQIGKLEHYKPEYVKIHPFRKVPAIDDNGFKLIERYLTRKCNVLDHWYPSALKGQAKVDEYIEWHHLNTRLHCSSYFLVKFLNPLLKGTSPTPEKVAFHEKQMISCLDLIENVWLKDSPFLVGHQISIADLLASCEIEQPRVAGFDVAANRPRLSAWLQRVRSGTGGFYELAHQPLNNLIAKNKKLGTEQISSSL